MSLRQYRACAAAPRWILVALPQHQRTHLSLFSAVGPARPNARSPTTTTGGADSKESAHVPSALTPQVEAAMFTLDAPSLRPPDWSASFGIVVGAAQRLAVAYLPDPGGEATPTGDAGSGSGVALVDTDPARPLLRSLLLATGRAGWGLRARGDWLGRRRDKWRHASEILLGASSPCSWPPWGKPHKGRRSADPINRIWQSKSLHHLRR